MADIRIKDLPTTATQTSSDDFIALDGTTNGTRKLSAYNPSFGGAITGVSLTAPTTTNLTLAGGSTGATVVIGQGTTAASATITPTGTGNLLLQTNAQIPTTGCFQINNTSGAAVWQAFTSGATTMASFSRSSNALLIKGGGGAGAQVSVGYTGEDLTLAGGSTGASLVLGQGASGNLVMSANSAERARLTTTGNLLIGSTTDSSSRLKLVGTDNSGPKTWTASSAALSGGLLDSYQDSGGNGFQRYTDIVSLQDSDGVNGGGVIRFVTNSISSDSGTEAMRVTKLQNLLIGTTTDSGNGKLQLATHTTSAGGIGFGPDNQLFRYGSVQLALTNSSGTSGSAIASNMQLRVENSGNGGIQVNVPDASTGGIYFGRSTDAYYTGIERSGTNLQLRNAGATALTLASNQAATFAGAVTVNAISGINALAAGTQLATFESSVNGAAVELITKGKNSTGTARQANIGINRFADDVLSFSNGTTESLRLHLTTQAATFAGAVTTGGKITSSVSTATGYNQLYDTTGITTGRGAFAITSTGAGLAFGIESSVGGTSFTGSTAYASYFGTTTATPIHFVTNSAIRATIDSTGAATFAGAVTVATNLTMGAASGIFTIGADTRASDLFIDINTAAANGRLLRFQTAGVSRWQMGASSTAEGGANAGSNFVLNAYSDAGALLSAPLSITRSTGAATFAGDIVGKKIVLDVLGEQLTMTRTGVGTAVLAVGGSAELYGKAASYAFYNAAGSSAYLTIASSAAATFAGAVSVNSVTPSTGAGSGALQVAGGIYAGANSVFGGNVTIPSSILYTNNIYNYTGGATPLTLGWTGSAAVLSLFSSGAATFAGAVTTTSTGFSATNASGSVEFLGSRSSTSTGVTVTYKTGATLNWFHGLRGLVDNNWYLFNNGTSTNTLIFDYGTNAATFAGTVIAPAATTAISSVRLPHGAAPTSPVNGDMWTTTAGLYVRINGVTVGPLS